MIYPKNVTVDLVINSGCRTTTIVDRGSKSPVSICGGLVFRLVGIRRNNPKEEGMQLYDWKVRVAPEIRGVRESMRAFNEAPATIDYVEEALVHQLSLPGLRKPGETYTLSRSTRVTLQDLKEVRKRY